MGDQWSVESVRSSRVTFARHSEQRSKLSAVQATACAAFHLSGLGILTADGDSAVTYHLVLW